MDLAKIDELLEKYWNGESTVEEEQALKCFFNENEVPPKYKDVAPLFQYYNYAEAELKLSDDFDELVLGQVKKEQKKSKVKYLFSEVLKVAAVILVLVTAGYFMYHDYAIKKDERLAAETFENPERAFEETKKALLLISKNINKGRKEAQKVGVFHEAQKRIKETETL